MSLGNSDERYGAITIALHWAGAVAVMLMLTTAAWAWLAPDHPAAAGRLRVHGAIGVLLYLVIVARIAWHAVDRQPRKLADRPVLNAAAKAVQVAMLVLVAAQLLTGPVDVWSGGWPIDVFGWFALPSPLGSALKVWHDPIGDVHRFTGYSIAVLLAVHIAAALKHLLIDRDGTVQRMLGLPLPVVPPKEFPG